MAFSSLPATDINERLPRFHSRLIVTSGTNAARLVRLFDGPSMTPSASGNPIGGDQRDHCPNLLNKFGSIFSHAPRITRSSLFLQLPEFVEARLIHINSHVRSFHYWLLAREPKQAFLGGFVNCRPRNRASGVFHPVD